MCNAGVVSLQFITRFPPFITRFPPHFPHSRPRSYALQSDVSKSSPWLTFMGWVSQNGDALAPLCCRSLENLATGQGSLLVSAFTPRAGNYVLRVLPFYHR